MTTQWFDVDKTGLGKQAEQQSKGRLIGELVQNALDEAGVTEIAVKLTPVPGRPLADLTVEDDSPEGFRDLAHAYTLFAESYKRGNPEKRGQFNLGEKFVLAVCEQASISTTKGTVLFTDEGRIERPRQKRDRGSVFQGRIRLTREEYPQVADYLRSLLLPGGVTVSFNGDGLLPRTPIRTFEASLETLVADEQGVMRPRVRKAEVGIFEPLPGETPGLYEMGLPVVETGDRWHVNVQQKVPLNRDRDNVRPAYLQAVRVAVANVAYDLLTTEDEATQGWVKLAGSDPRISDDAIKHLVRLRFGEKVAAPDPSDTEAMKRFTAQGGTIVVGLSKGEWANVRRSGAVPPAGQVCPTAKPYSDDPNAKAVTLIPEEKWTDGIKNIAAYARFLARELMGVPLVVSVVHTTNNFAACYGAGRLDFTSAEFEEMVLRSPTPALVDFDAEWCGPCRLLAPTLAELAEELQGRVAIFKINAPANSDLATRLEITALPTISFFQEGHEIARLVGLQNRERLLAQVEEFAKRATRSRVFMMDFRIPGRVPP